MSDIRYLYVRDPRCEDRVLTIARKISLDANVMAVTWCVNRVSVYEHKKFDAENNIRFKYKDIAIYDVFNKALARKICAGRLEVGRAILMELPEIQNTRVYLTCIVKELQRHPREWAWASERYATEIPSLPLVRRILSAAYHDGSGDSL